MTNITIADKNIVIAHLRDMCDINDDMTFRTHALCDHAIDALNAIIANASNDANDDDNSHDDDVVSVANVARMININPKCARSKIRRALSKKTKLNFTFIAKHRVRACDVDALCAFLRRRDDANDANDASNANDETRVA